MRALYFEFELFEFSLDAQLYDMFFHKMVKIKNLRPPFFFFYNDNRKMDLIKQLEATEEKGKKNIYKLKSYVTVCVILVLINIID